MDLKYLPSLVLQLAEVFNQSVKSFSKYQLWYNLGDSNTGTWTYPTLEWSALQGRSSCSVISLRVPSPLRGPLSHGPLYPRILPWSLTWAPTPGGGGGITPLVPCGPGSGKHSTFLKGACSECESTRNTQVSSRGNLVGSCDGLTVCKLSIIMLKTNI